MELYAKELRTSRCCIDKGYSFKKKKKILPKKVSWRIEFFYGLNLFNLNYFVYLLEIFIKFCKYFFQFSLLIHGNFCLP